MTYEEQENWSNVQYRMDNEGLEYCFKHYSSFEEIKDDKFHQLREELINKIDEIRGYVDEKLNQEIDDDDII
jgi:hypothetical protein